MSYYDEFISGGPESNQVDPVTRRHQFTERVYGVAPELLHHKPLPDPEDGDDLALLEALPWVTIHDPRGGEGVLTIAAIVTSDEYDDYEVRGAKIFAKTPDGAIKVLGAIEDLCNQWYAGDLTDGDIIISNIGSDPRLLETEMTPRVIGEKSADAKMFLTVADQALDALTGERTLSPEMRVAVETAVERVKDHFLRPEDEERQANDELGILELNNFSAVFDEAYFKPMPVIGGPHPLDYRFRSFAPIIERYKTTHPEIWAESVAAYHEYRQYSDSLIAKMLSSGNTDIDPAVKAASNELNIRRKQLQTRVFLAILPDLITEGIDPLELVG